MHRGSPDGRPTLRNRSRQNLRGILMDPEWHLRNLGAKRAPSKENAAAGSPAGYCN